ncbi:PLP-dependent aminotransferase family protein [Marinicellulosiphila megalodicopiae]|uniref:aminotransferase-like domain-containing protein n=1 Tax=Marinicellulosiphila megalodicopiae TaxID=2724896 RepID=UPI003BAF08D2
MTFTLSPTKAVQAIKPSYIREILAATHQAGMISLAGGLPNESAFPMEIIEQSMQEIKSDRTIFQYGSTQGYPPLLNYVREQYVVREQDDAMIGTGSQQCLDLIARGFIAPGDHIVMEAPSYLGALQIFELAQANIHSIGENESLTGPDLTQLENTFKQNDVKFFYAVPDFHNPTGICWSLEVRKAVASLCKQYEVFFIEDVPYRDLRFKNEPIAPVSDFYENCFVLRSFSKIATPGLRLGSVIGNKTLINTLVKIKQTSDLHSSIPMQALLLKLLTHENFPKHIENIKQKYQTHHDAMLNAINEHLSEYAEAKSVDGGMFLWVALKHVKAADVETVARTLLKANVAVVPSNVFYPSDFALEDQQVGFRLNFTHASVEKIEQAIGIIKVELAKLAA